MCKGPEEGIGTPHTRNIKKNDTPEMEFVCCERQLDKADELEIEEELK